MMLRAQTTAYADTHVTHAIARPRRIEPAMRPSFIAFLEVFDPGQFRKDAGYRLRIDQALQTLSEIETTIFCRIYLKLLAP